MIGQNEFLRKDALFLNVQSPKTYVPPAQAESPALKKTGFAYCNERGDEHSGSPERNHFHLSPGGRTTHGNQRF